MSRQPMPRWCLFGESSAMPEATITPQTVTIPTSARGTAVLLRTCLQQYPFTERSPGLEPFLSVELDGCWHPAEPDELCDLADALAGVADRLQSVAGRFNDLTSAADPTPQAHHPG